MRLLLLAHGATAATRRGAFANGESLEAAAPRRERAWRCDLALTSPAPAARETARLLSLDATVEPALRDLAVGAWAGRAFAEIAADDPAGAAAFLADPAFAGHGGESVASLIARLDAWMETRRAGRGRLVAVTHAAVVRAVAVAALGAPAQAFWQIDVAPLAGLAFSSDGRRWSLRAGDGVAAWD